MGIIGDAVHASRNSLLIDAYNRNGRLMEATASALVAGKSGEQLLADSGVQAARAETDTAIRWFVWPAYLAEAGAIIGTITYELNWSNPDAAKLNFRATTWGIRLGGKVASTLGFMQAWGNCVANDGASTMIGIGAAVGFGLGLYFFFRDKDFLGFQFGIAAGLDIGVAGSSDGKFTRLP
jgi:hypothetical protein